MRSPSSYGFGEVPDTWLLPSCILQRRHIDLRPSIPRRQQSISFDRRASTTADMNERYLYTFEPVLEMLQPFMFRPKIACSTRLTRAACSPIVTEFRLSCSGQPTGCVGVQALASTVLALLLVTLSLGPQKMEEAFATAQRASRRRGTDTSASNEVPYAVGRHDVGCGAQERRLAVRSRQSQSADPRSNMIRPGAIMFVQTHDPATIRTRQQVTNAKAGDRNG
jgi:hypothetical protein